MLTIKTVKNHFSTLPTNRFCFRSSSSQTLSLSELAAEMADYNSSFTKADIEGMLSILNTVAIKFLAKGYSVVLPFCTIRVGVTGTCQNIQDSFSPGNGNNHIAYLLSMSEAAKKDINSRLEYKQITPEATGDACIYQICSVNQDASESTNLNLSAGDIIRIRGKNLSFDFNDTKQGLVLYGENTEFQIRKFNRIGTNVIDFVVPSDIAAGKYTVSLTTKPGVYRYSDTSCDMVITIN